MKLARVRIFPEGHLRRLEVTLNFDGPRWFKIKANEDQISTEFSFKLPAALSEINT